MKQEEYLDRLIERHEYKGSQRSVSNDKTTASLAAAEMLARLQEINVPTDFARRLEVSIRALCRTRQKHKALSRIPRRSPMRSAWIATLSTAAVLLLAFTGLLTASAHSLPGDPLYSLKQAENQLTLTFAPNPQSRASAETKLLQSALVDLKIVVNSRYDDDAIKLALHIVASETDDYQRAVTALPAGPEHDTAQQDLDAVIAQEEQTVRQLLKQVDWPVRLLFTHQLGNLGDAVPAVTSILVSVQPDGTLLITLTGTHFAPQAELIIDGQPGGTVSQESVGQLLARLPLSELPPGPHAFGVLNPDGTAAQMALKGDDDHDAPDDIHHQNGTPDLDRDTDDTYSKVQKP